MCKKYSIFIIFIIHKSYIFNSKKENSLNSLILNQLRYKSSLINILFLNGFRAAPRIFSPRYGRATIKNIINNIQQHAIHIFFLIPGPTNWFYIYILIIQTLRKDSM